MDMEMEKSLLKHEEVTYKMLELRAMIWDHVDWQLWKKRFEVKEDQ